MVNLYVVNGQGGTQIRLQAALAGRQHRLVEGRTAEIPEAGGATISTSPRTRATCPTRRWNDDHILTSTAERAGFALLALGPHDAFRLRTTARAPGIFSWWDYRAAGFRRNLGLRIDLDPGVSDALVLQAVVVGIDREPRTWERPSDHAPAWVQLIP